jgi:hypothetical protein
MLLCSAVLFKAAEVYTNLELEHREQVLVRNANLVVLLNFQFLPVTLGLSHFSAVRSVRVFQ